MMPDHRGSAHGTASEQALLILVVEAMRDLIEDESPLSADAGYHREAKLEHFAGINVQA